MIYAICGEMSLSKEFIEAGSIETVYFGGGTPSLLTPEELQTIFGALHKHFTISADAEITLESNPDDINMSVLQSWKQLGINRLSVGLQSFSDAELKWMNRAHHASQSIQCIEDIQRAGFTNFSADLIYGSHLQSNEDLIKNFNIVAQKNVPHISCYALTVEPGTALSHMIKNNKSPASDPDKQAEQFFLLSELAEENGYEQYELSNYAKPGLRSRHNSSYWKGEPYYGFGPGAHSFNGTTERRWNISNNSLYIQSICKNIVPCEAEILTARQRLNEYIMTTLRTAEGLDLAHVAKNFGEKESERISTEAYPFLKNKKMILRSPFLVLTQEGKFLADGIAASLFADIN